MTAKQGGKEGVNMIIKNFFCEGERGLHVIIADRMNKVNEVKANSTTYKLYGTSKDGKIAFTEGRINNRGAISDNGENTGVYKTGDDKLGGTGASKPSDVEGHFQAF